MQNLELIYKSCTGGLHSGEQCYFQSTAQCTVYWHVWLIYLRQIEGNS